MVNGNINENIGIPLSIKETGMEEKQFRVAVDAMSESYMSYTSQVVPDLDKLTPDARRAAGIPPSVTEVKELYIHTWNGTRADLG